MLFRHSQNYKSTMLKKVKGPHRICMATALTKIFRFLFSLSTFVAVATPKEWMHRFPRNMLQFRPIPFRCTKMKVLNSGDTSLYLVLKSTNEDKPQSFSTFKLPTFLVEFLR